MIRIAIAMALVFAGLWFKLAPLIIVGGVLIVADAIIERKE